MLYQVYIPVVYFGFYYPFFKQGLYGFSKGMKIDNAIFQDLKVLEKRVLTKLQWKNFGFLFWKILKCLKMDILMYGINHFICYEYVLFDL